jgi:hypothetical protein
MYQLSHSASNLKLTFPHLTFYHCSQSFLYVLTIIAMTTSSQQPTHRMLQHHETLIHHSWMYHFPRSTDQLLWSLNKSILYRHPRLTFSHIHHSFWGCTTKTVTQGITGKVFSVYTCLASLYISDIFLKHFKFHGTFIIIYMQHFPRSKQIRVTIFSAKIIQH